MSKIRQGEYRLHELLSRIKSEANAAGLKENLSDLSRIIEEIKDSVTDLSRYGRLLFEEAAQIFLMIRWNDRGIVESSRGASDAFGRPREELLNLKLDDLVAADVQALASWEDRPCTFETFFQRRDGSVFPAEVTASGMTFKNEKIIFCAVRDITGVKETEARLRTCEARFRELSIRDPLTGLFNLKHFYDELKLEIERASRYFYPLSLLMIDVDDFKSINSRYGHHEGDKMLRRMAETLMGHIRNVDSIYRYGGEEFTVILPETGNDEAVMVAQRIRAGFEKENFSTIPGTRVRATVSIGVALYSMNEELISFLGRADRNMYMAKAQGRNCVFYQEKEEGEETLLA